MKVLLPVILYFALVLVLGFVLALTAPRVNREMEDGDGEG